MFIQIHVFIYSILNYPHIIYIYIYISSTLNVNKRLNSVYYTKHDAHRSFNKNIVIIFDLYMFNDIQVNEKHINDKLCYDYLQLITI